MAPSTQPTVTAIVTGAAGQDGFYLVGRLLAEGRPSMRRSAERGARPDLEALPNADRLDASTELEITDADCLPDGCSPTSGRTSSITSPG